MATSKTATDSAVPLEAGAVEGLADLGAAGTLATLRARTHHGLPHPSRLAAIRALARVGRGDTVALRTLLTRTRDPFLRVRLAAIGAAYCSLDGTEIAHPLF